MHADVYNIMRILKSLGANYPVIRTLGYEFTKPLLLVVSGDGLKRTKDVLTIYDAPKTSEFAKCKDVDKMLQETNSEFAFFAYSMSKKGKEQMQYLISVMQLGIAGKKAVNALPLIISNGKISRDDMNRFFVIYVREDLSDYYIPLEEVIPLGERLEVALDKIYQLDMQGKSQEEKALLSAVCFIYPNLKKEGRATELRELLDCASAMAIQDDGSFANVKDIFINEIYLWQERTGFCNVFQLPALEMEATRRLDEVVLYDQKYLYMKEKLLANVAESLLDIVTMDTLKAALAENGILCPECEETYTVKVNYRNISGGYERVRMLRFAKDSLDKWGELGLIELCLSRKEEL